MGAGTIVVVEDRLVSNLVRAVLRRQGYQVTLADTAAEATALIEAPESSVAILITNAPADYLQFSERVRLVYLSSQPDPALEAAFPSCQVVVKPFIPQELVQAVDALTETR